MIVSLLIAADSFGDGWSFGSSLDVSVGGVSIANASIGGSGVSLRLVLQFVLLMDVPIKLQITTIQQPTQMTVHVLMHVFATFIWLKPELTSFAVTSSAGDTLWSISGQATNAVSDTTICL